MTVQGLTHLTTLLIRFPFARASSIPESSGPYSAEDIKSVMTCSRPGDMKACISIWL
jgi:hypothetical protein